MTHITNASDTWSSTVTPTNDETWRVHGGAIWLTSDTGVSGSTASGIPLFNGEAVRVPASTGVKYRLMHGEESARICRAEVG